MAGRKRTCHCGDCRRCRLVEYHRKRRAGLLKANPPEVKRTWRDEYQEPVFAELDAEIAAGRGDEPREAA